MAEPLLSFRTVTECEICVYKYEGSPPKLVPHPIALPANPSSFDVSPSITQQDIEQTGCTGEDQIIYTYSQKTVPEISIGFGLGTPELEGLIINRLAETRTNYDGWVYFSAIAEKESITGKAAGKYGNSVVTQAAATSQARVFYMDPLTKLAKQLAIVDSAPAGDQIMIGANLALTLSPELAATGYNIYGWVPAPFANATVLGASSVPMISVHAIGVCFDESVRLFSARKCSFLPGGSLTKDPKRDVKMRVLADQASTTAAGYSIVYLRDKIAC